MEVTLCFIDFAGTPATISSSGTSCITDAPEPTMTLLPIFSLCFTVELSPSQQVSPIMVLPPITAPAVSAQSLPISTLCATCTRASSFVPSPITVSDSEPRAIEQLELISTLLPILTPPICGNLSKSKVSCLSYAKPSAPITAPGCTIEFLPITQFCRMLTLPSIIVLSVYLTIITNNCKIADITILTDSCAF